LIPTVSIWRAWGQLARQNLDVASEFTKGYLRPAKEAPIAPGEGRIVNGDNGKEAHYQAQDGAYHRRSAICPHMKCVVNWNPAEQTWDCPCHGSRFTGDGRVIHGPALTNLEAKV
jgi:Rieske Fe-S protein